MDYKALHLLLRYGREYGHGRIREKGLTDTEHLISSYVFMHEACSQEEAVKALHLDKTTLGKAVDALTAKGFLVRQQAREDKRKNLLCLTPAGKERIGDILRIHDEWSSRVLSVLSQEEQEAFDGYLRRILKEAEAICTHKEEKTTL